MFVLVLTMRNGDQFAVASDCVRESDAIRYAKSAVRSMFIPYARKQRGHQFVDIRLTSVEAGEAVLNVPKVK